MRIKLNVENQDILIFLKGDVQISEQLENY